MSKLHVFIPEGAPTDGITNEYAGSEITSGTFMGEEGAYVSIPYEARPGPKMRKENPCNIIADRLSTKYSLANKGPIFPPDGKTVIGVDVGLEDLVWRLG